MGVKISQLDPLTGGLTKYDKFEIEKNSDGKSYSCSGEQIKNYASSANNGRFRGTTDKNLDSFTIEDVGVWHWTGAGGPVDITTITTGIVEVISYVDPEDVNGNTYMLIQRLTDGLINNRVYQREYKNGAWTTNWGKLYTTNTCTIKYGASSATSVTFDVPFQNVPAVIVTPAADNPNYVYSIKLSHVDASGFSVQKHVSETTAVVVSEESETVVQESGATPNTKTTTTTTTTTTTRGAWTTNSEMGFYWIAILDER